MSNIQMTASFHSDLVAFAGAHREKVDRALAHYSQNIEISIKTGGRIPRRHSVMQGAVSHRKVTDGHYQVIAAQNYSAAQEAGEINRNGKTIIFRNYSTPGTGKGWFAEAIEKNKDSLATFLAAEQ